MTQHYTHTHVDIIDIPAALTVGTQCSRITAERLRVTLLLRQLS